jgi:hypothetical protein
MSLEYLQYGKFPLVVNVSPVHLSDKTNGSLRKGWRGKEGRKNKMKGEELGKRKMGKTKRIQQERCLGRKKCG